MSRPASEPRSHHHLSSNDRELDGMNLAIISQAPHAAAAFRGLYELHKRLYRYMSFGYIMRRTGIASKGYLSHVMNGDRRLNGRYHDALCEVFKLDAASSHMLRDIWLREESLSGDRRAARNAAQFPRSPPGLSQAV